MSVSRPFRAFLPSLVLTALFGWPSRAMAQYTEPFDILDNVEGDFVNLNAAPVRPMAMTPDNATLFAANTHASRIVRFDLVTGTTTKTFHTAKSPVSVALWNAPGSMTPTERLVVVCRDTYALLIHNRATGDVMNVLELRDSSGRILGEPGDLLVDDAADRAFVSCQAADAVVEVDLTIPAVTRVFRLPCKNPLFMCFDSNQDVLVAPLFSGNNSGARRRESATVNPMHAGPTVLDFETVALGGTQLPDEDLFRIVRATGAVQPLTTDAGTIQFAVGVNPFTQQVWQLNTDANNKDPNRQTEASIAGDIVVNQLSISALPAVGLPKTTPLQRVDLDQVTGGYDPSKSVGQPYALAFGQFGYAVVAGLLTDNVMLLSPSGGFVSEFDLDDGSIPRGLLYSPLADRVIVYCWGTNTIDVRQVGLAWTQVFELSLGLDPTPERIKNGRRIAYSAEHSAKNNASCFSCHIEGRTDMLVWNLGSATDDKGPLVTQTLDGIEKMVPFHWRAEQQRNLVDFNPAFVNLLGASQPLTSADFADFEAYVFSLQNPPNPFEDERRVVNNSFQPNLTVPTITAQAVKGKRRFEKGTFCESCHNGPLGTSNDLVPDGVGFGDENPRRTYFKVGPFHELYRKEQDVDPLSPGVQLHTVKMNRLGAPGTESHEYPLLGAGLLHAGLAPSTNAFVEFFPFDPNPTAELQAEADVTAFLMQYDQGIAPATYRAVLLDQANHAMSSPALTTYFVPQALARHCDLVLFGKHTVNGALVPMRWWFDRRRASGAGEFVPDDGGPTRGLAYFQNQALLGQASVTCVGLPVGTGEQFGIDFDLDQLPNGKELTHVPPTQADVSDSDGDQWPDGYEHINGGNPMDNQVLPNDTQNPTIQRAVTQFVTGKVARINVETDEPCVIEVSYSSPGEPVRTVRTKELARTHSVLLNDLRQSNAQPRIYSGTITAIDRSARPSSAVPLPPMPSYNGGGPITTRSFNDLPGVAVVGDLSWTVTKSPGGNLVATASVRVDERISGPPANPLENHIVIARIFKNGVLDSTWAPEGRSTLIDVFDVRIFGVQSTFTGLSGPFVTSTTTDATGTATIEFSMTNLSTNDEVTLNIEVIGLPWVDTAIPHVPVDPPLILDGGNRWNMPGTQSQFRGLTEVY